MSTTKGGELTVEVLLAEVRTPRPGEEGDLEAPILAEKTAQSVENVTSKQNKTAPAHTKPGKYDELIQDLGGDFINIWNCYKDIVSVVTEKGLNFYALNPTTKKYLPIPGLQGIMHRLPGIIISIDQMVSGHPFVIEYVDAKKGRWVSVFDITTKKVTHLIKMEVPGQIKFEGDMIRVGRNGQEEMYFFYKDGIFYTFDTKSYYGYGALLSGLMRKVTKSSTKKKSIPHDYENAKKYLIATTTPVVVK